MHAFRKLWFVALALGLIAACVPTQPTPDPGDIQSQIQTSVALTVAAQGTQTAAAQPPVTMTFTPTNTPFVIPSVTPVLATPTPFVISPPSGGGGTSPQAKYACDVITRPFDNTKFNSGAHFDIKWTIVNTGSATWDAGLDLIYFSGPHMASPETTIELPKVKPGESYYVNLDGTAPNAKGFHVMTWKLQGGWCFPYIAIIVK